MNRVVIVVLKDLKDKIEKIKPVEFWIDETELKCLLDNTHDRGKQEACISILKMIDELINELEKVGRSNE